MRGSRGVKFGDAVQITLSVHDLSVSRAFYDALGFVTVAQNELPYPWTQITDGRNLILLGEDDMAFRGLTYFAADMKDRVDRISSMGVRVSAAGFNIGDVFQAIIHDPNGLPISLVAYDAARLSKPDGTPRTLCGAFGELSLPTADLAASRAFWEQFEFQCVHASDTPHPYAILSDGLLTIGLHQTSAFSERTLAYFSDDSAERIRAIKDLGLIPAFEIPDGNGTVVHACFQSPEEQDLFVFGNQ